MVRHRCVTGFMLSIFLIGISLIFSNVKVIASENEHTYIVQYSDSDVSLFSASKFNYTIEPYELIDEKTLQECLSKNLIKWYEEDYEVTLFDNNICLNDEMLSDKWDWTLMETQNALRIGCKGQGVKIGIIDSGINEHPDLSGNVEEGFNYLTNTNNVKDNIGHGTFVSGLIGANINEIGFFGVASEAKIVPLKCFDSGVKTKVSTICSAIYDAVDKYECNVINMSLGLTEYSEAFENAIKYAKEKNVIIVAAVGNAGTDTLYYPAAFDGVIGVGAINISCEKADFSQYNSSVKVVAPGENVLSTNNNNGYTTKSGTSFATPLMSGVVALILNINPSIGYDGILDIIQNNSTEAGIEGYDVCYGYGIVNVHKYIEYMLRDVSYFISPVSIENETSKIVILNNTNDVFEGICMWGQYDSKVMKMIDGRNISIVPNETVTLINNFTYERVKFCLWKSINDISIIAREREAIK